jgi:bifunctional non-homologous end joining protein LigD
MKNSGQLEIEGRTLKLSNLDKVLYPAAHFTKAQVIDYYIRIAPVLLPHLRGRAVTLKRYPDGVEGFFFYEKQCPSHRPDWIKTTAVASERRASKRIDYCTLDDVASLVWAANLADLELHPFLHLARDISRPIAMAFDLDPGPPADVRACCRVAMWLRELLKEDGLECFPKTSGSKGLQLFVPLNTKVTYAKTKAFAKDAAESLERQHSRYVVSRMQKSMRRGKVLIDWSQNDPHKTTVCVYSLRARPQPTVSTPVTWDEVEAAARTRGMRALVFTSEQVLRRIKQYGDLFAPVLDMKQRLPAHRNGTAIPPGNAIR